MITIIPGFMLVFFIRGYCQTNDFLDSIKTGLATAIVFGLPLGGLLYVFTHLVVKYW